MSNTAPQAGAGTGTSTPASASVRLQSCPDPAAGGDEWLCQLRLSWLRGICMWKLLNEFQSKGHHTCQKLSAYYGKQATGTGELSLNGTGQIHPRDPRQSWQSSPRGKARTGVSTPGPTLIPDLSGKARCDRSAQAVCWNVWAHQQPQPSTGVVKYVFNAQSRRKKNQSWNPRIPHWLGIELHLKITLPWEPGAVPTAALF